MDFEDSDWTLAAEQPPPATGPRVALGSLLAGVALGAIAASGLWWAFAGPRAAAPVAGPAAAVRAEAAPAAASAASAVSATTSVATDTAAATRSTSPAVRDDDERKALAWSRYYQRPASCEGNPSTEQLVECANHFIRTKRLFDAEWAAGRL